jgi:hypothetical protein
MSALFIRPLLVALLALATLVASARETRSDAGDFTAFRPKSGGIGRFEAIVKSKGESGPDIKYLFAQFKKRSPDFELRGWHIHFQFKDKDGKEYKMFRQPIQKGPDLVGKYEPDIPGGVFNGKPGELAVRLYETHEGKEVHIATLKFDIKKDD